MFKSLRSLFITFAILGSLVILTGTRYSDTTPNPSLSITDDGTAIIFSAPQGHVNTAVALGAAAVTFSADTNHVTVTGDAGSNTITTITSGTSGETATFLFVDALVTISDDDGHGADTIDLDSPFTSADDVVLTLLFDGTSWYEVTRSISGGGGFSGSGTTNILTKFTAADALGDSSITDDGSTVDFSTPITGSVSAGTLRIDSVIVNALQAAGATLNGSSAVIKGQSGGTCCAEGAGTAGGQVQITSGAGGPGTGAAASGAGASVVVTGGAAGADGGAGQGLGGGISFIGGAGATSADQGAISYQGRRHLWATSGTSRWEIDISGNLLPITDSASDIGTETVRVSHIYTDDITIGGTSLGFSADGSAASVFLKRDANNELAQRNSTAAQMFRPYNTFTDASNYTRANVGWQSNIFNVTTDSAGTGPNRNMVIGTEEASTTLTIRTNAIDRWLVDGNGTLRPFVNNTYDIGADDNGAEDIFLNDRLGHVNDLNTFLDFGTDTLDLSAGGLDQIHLSSAGIIVNEFGFAGVDIRVETDTVTDAFFIDGGAETAAFNVPLTLNNVTFETDSTHDIGTTTVRPDEIFVDDLIAEQVTWSAAGSAADLFLKRDGANVLAQRNSTTAQNFRLYRTRTNASNYERLNIGLSGVTFQVVTEGAGTGAARDLNVGTLGASNLVLLTANLAKWRVLSAGNFVPFANDTYDIGLTSSGVRVVYVATRIEHAGDTDTFIDFKSNVIDFDAGGIELMSLDHASIDPAGIIFNGSADIDMDLTWRSDNVSDAFFLDAGTDSAEFNVPQGHGNTAVALGAAAVTFSADTNFVTVTGDGGANTIATITSGTVGEKLTLLFVDALVTVTDDDSHAADSVDLSAAFTGADDTTLTLLYDGTSWYEVSRSVN